MFVCGVCNFADVLRLFCLSSWVWGWLDLAGIRFGLAWAALSGLIVIDGYLFDDCVDADWAECYGCLLFCDLFGFSI